METTDPLVVAEAFTAGFAARDSRQIGKLYADDVIIWHNNDRIEQSKADNLASIELFFAMTADVHYASITRTRTEHGFVQQHEIQGHFADGRALPLIPACLVFTLRDGLITRLDEYIDPAPFLAVMNLENAL